MSDMVLTSPPRPTLPVQDGRLFPVRRVYCIGRNYAEHTREMGHDPDRDPPFYFQKNPENLDPSGEFPYPSLTQDVHHEVELLVALRSGGRDIPADKAMDHVWGYAVALDMTRRDLQGQMKATGRPWEIGKAFERSAPVGRLMPAEGLNMSQGAITLTLNGSPRQSGDLSQMIWSIPEQIAYLSRTYDIAAGDVILTGTPAGVGPVTVGDVMEARIDGLPDLSVRVV